MFIPKCVPPTYLTKNHDFNKNDEDLSGPLTIHTRIGSFANMEAQPQNHLTFDFPTRPQDRWSCCVENKK